MPPEVQRAYREKLNLQQLFSSPALRDWKHRVMQRFLREIVKIRGNTEVTLRPDNVIVDVASLAENRGRVLPEEVISAVCASPDYGGKEGTLPILAEAMEPKWQFWWASFRLLRAQPSELKIMSYVLGPKQLSWIAAQSARLVLPYAGDLYGISEQAVDIAERLITDGDAMSEYSSILYDITQQTPARNDRRQLSASVSRSALLSAASIGDPTPSASDAVYGAISVIRMVRGSAAIARYTLESMIRWIITPTLITHASRGLQ